VLELLELLQRAAGTSLEPRFEPLRRGELLRSALDPSSIESELGWRARIDLAEGLAATYRTYAGY
jgi:UDP-glucose 4-epimerase